MIEGKVEWMNKVKNAPDADKEASLYMLSSLKDGKGRGVPGCSKKHPSMEVPVNKARLAPFSIAR